MKTRVFNLLKRVKCMCMGVNFYIIISEDKKGGDRFFIQLEYLAPCSKNTHVESWKGRKWYLSEHMTDDEIIKTVWCAFEAAVKHEVMEGFTVDGVVLFNPHVNFEELLSVSHKEVTRL